MRHNITSAAWLSLWTSLLLGRAVKAQDTSDELSYIYLDNTQYLANGSNVVAADWTLLQAAFRYPNKTDSASYAGFDWTKPYPGSALSGFGAHLRIVDDIEFPNATVYNQSTEVSAVTYSVPDTLMGSDGVPLAMHPSWYVCQHYYISTWPDPTQPVDHTCGFLPDDCLADIKSNLTAFWGQLDPDIPCSGMALEAIPVSCQGTLGVLLADVLGFDSSFFSDAATASALAVDEVNQNSWMVGTGYVDLYNETAYYAASNRTYLIATVFGYSSSGNVSGVREPTAELACLRPAWEALPPPPAVSTQTSSTTTSTATASSRVPTATSSSSRVPTATSSSSRVSTATSSSSRVSTAKSSSSSACTAASSVAVTFDELVTTLYGQTIKIIGDVNALGNWDPDNAVTLSAADYAANDPLWFATITFPAGEVIQYKYINVQSNGTVDWEADPNHIYTVPATCATAVTKSDSWQH